MKLRTLLMCLMLTLLSVPAIAGTISGTVTDGTSQQPVAGVSVQLYNATSGAPVLKVAKTDATGAYTISSVSAASYKVLFYGNKSTTEPYVQKWYGGTTLSSALSVTVTSTSTSTGINAVMSTVAQPRLTFGSASEVAAGSVVKIPVTLTTGGAAISTAGFSISYDPTQITSITAFDPTDGTPAIGAAATAAGKSISENIPVDGSYTGLVSSSSTNLIGDGDLMYLYVQLAADAKGTITLAPVPDLSSPAPSHVETAAVSGTIAFARTAQTVTFPQPAAMTYGTTQTISASASSGLGVTFSSSNSSICSVAGSVVTASGVGSCVITASQAGNTDYLPATATRTITVSQADQTVTVTAPSLTYLGGSGTVSASSTSGLTAFTYSSSTTGVCTVSNNTVQPVAGGTCTITATQAGNANYKSASATKSFSIAKANQTISFGQSPTTLSFGGTAVVSASASSTLPVTYSSTTTGVCTVSSTTSGATVTPVSVGSCIVAADQSGSTNYNSAQQTHTIAIGKANQTITFTALPSLTYGGGSGTVTASSDAGLTSFSYSSGTTGVCTVTGNTVQPVSAGTCTITATQAGDTTHNSAQGTQSFSIAKAVQTISFTGTPSLTYGGSSATLAATASSGLTGITFSSSTPGVCAVTGAAVAPVTGGSCTVVASLAASTNYLAATTPLTFTVGRAVQSITFSAPTAINFTDAPTLAPSASSQLTVALASKTTGVCTVAGYTVTPVSAGTCTLEATQAGDTNFGAATPETRSITINAVAPGTPTSVRAIPGNGEATILFTAPASTGGSVITAYTVTSTPGGFTGTGTGTSVVVKGLTNGTAYTFKVTATNAAGTSAASAATSSVTPNILTVAVGAPSATVVASSGTVTFAVSYTGAANVTLSAADVVLDKTGSANGTVAVSGSGTSTRTVTISGITGNGTLGISILAGTATDSTGTLTALPSVPSATFSVDNAAPALTVDTLANNSITSNKTLTVIGTVSDPSGVASLKINDVAVTFNTDGSYTYALDLVDGSNAIAVVATDSVGNAQSDTRTIVYDHTAPKIDATTFAPSEGSYTSNGTITLTGTLDKRGAVQVVVNGQNPIDAVMNGAGTGFSAQVTLGVGANTINVYATNIVTDNSSVTKSSAFQRHVTFDPNKPVLEITSPADSISTLLKTIPVSGTVSDATGITLTFSVAGQGVEAPAVTDGKFTKQVSFSDPKTYKISVTATDQAGNTSTVERNVVYRAVAIEDALRALRLSVGLETLTVADSMLDVGPILNGTSSPDGVVDIGDAVVLLNYLVGLP